MHPKQELLEKLTGIRSSRKSYYKELNYVVEEMKKKNKQLEIINQLTKIRINADWADVSAYLAEQLNQLLSFDVFVLTLMEGGSLALFASQRQQQSWTHVPITVPSNREAPSSVEELHDILQPAYLDWHMVSVPLQSRLQRSFGFLTLLQATRPQQEDEEQLILFRQIAEHIEVSVENILLFKDVSKKVGIEAQLVQSAKMAAIGEMAAGVAHELNSPLTAILGNAQLLLRQLPSDPLQQMTKDIYQCGVRCKKIIQNLLTFSRQEEYHFECLSVNELIEDVLVLIGYQLKVSGISISKQLSAEPLLFQGSRHQIEQILINLLLNARDALQDVPNPVITISSFCHVTADRSYVGVSVHDNGVGIEQESLSQIFQPFYTTKAARKGTGLGLSVSLGIAESHGGMVTVESEAGAYSTFTLLLPNYANEENASE
ncbi:histidine kinase [Brevibacillus humidisoli]|uniref:sensor histidine kinase n=1 Tax=Brevibacillus humidisoli TaxID=2895522 RepID=UPI001E3610CD|nr:ATP-binding protein [Brevibacillus humidisoli]UFJ41058.1 histidine kinase [Brevibacillus humidisoli]